MHPYLQYAHGTGLPGSVELRLVFASKFTPPPPNPPASRMISMDSTSSLRLWETDPYPIRFGSHPDWHPYCPACRHLLPPAVHAEMYDPQGCMIHFNIQFKIFIQTIMSQETNHRSAIIIILMFCRFQGLGSMKKYAFESLLTRIIPCHMQETAPGVPVPVSYRYLADSYILPSHPRKHNFHH